MISIIIPAFNQLDCTRQCVASILANTVGAYKLILVDNGSTEAVHDFFNTIPDATVIRSDENLGFAAGVNLGMAQAEGHVLLLNNDTLVPVGWLEGLRAALERAPDIGMVGPMSNYVSGSQLIPHLTFSSLEAINAFAVARRASHGGVLRDVARLVGFCLLIRDSVVAEVGLLDESFGLGNFEDDDYCVRVLRAGYRLCVDEGSFVFHYGSRTFQALGLVAGAWDSLLEENAARFRDKWELRPEDRIDAYRESIQRGKEAAALRADGDHEGALRRYAEAIRIAPRFARHHSDLAAALWEAGAREEAFERAKIALALDRGAADGEATLLSMARALNREAEALDCLAGGQGAPRDEETIIRPYQEEDEGEWMRVHAEIMSISHAWNYCIQERPTYEGYPSTRLVAEAEGRIVGLTDVQYENAPGELCFQKDSRGGYVLEFGRLPSHGGRGLGKRLIDATVEDAKRLGFNRLEYWTQDRKAQRYYRRLGLKEISRHYRFRFKPPQAIQDEMLKDCVGVEYLYGACVPEEWPLIREKYEIIEKHPLEPHLCVGFDLRF